VIEEDGDLISIQHEFDRVPVGADVRQTDLLHRGQGKTVIGETSPGLKLDQLKNAGSAGGALGIHPGGVSSASRGIQSGAKAASVRAEWEFQASFDRIIGPSVRPRERTISLEGVY